MRRTALRASIALLGAGYASYPDRHNSVQYGGKPRMELDDMNKEQLGRAAEIVGVAISVFAALLLIGAATVSTMQEAAQAALPALIYAMGIKFALIITKVVANKGVAELIAGVATFAAVLVTISLGPIPGLMAAAAMPVSYLVLLVTFKYIKNG